MANSTAQIDKRWNSPQYKKTVHDTSVSVNISRPFWRFRCTEPDGRVGPASHMATRASHAFTSTALVCVRDLECYFSLFHKNCQIIPTIVNNVNIGLSLIFEMSWNYNGRSFRRDSPLSNVRCIGQPAFETHLWAICAHSLILMLSIKQSRALVKNVHIRHSAFHWRAIICD